MITKSLLGVEKTKETCCNKVFKTFSSGQLGWTLTHEASCADVPVLCCILYECSSVVRLLEVLSALLLSHKKFTAQFLPNALTCDY